MRALLPVVGGFLMVLGASEAFSVFWSVYYRDGTTDELLISMAIPLVMGFLIYGVARGARKELTQGEGFAAVAVCWILAALFGALPFYLTGVLPSFVDAVFESASGFTTTGASVLTSIESAPKGVLFWRSFTHFLGGMGIILLALAILPLVGVGGMQLYKAEVPGPVAEKLKPRLAHTAKILWSVYVLLNAVEAILLMFGGMPLFDALCHAFGTMATGGFSTKSASIGHYNAYIQFVVAIFMIAAGTNFALHFAALKGRPRVYLKDPEARFFFKLIFVSILVYTLVLWAVSGQDLFTAFRHAFFQVPAIVTTTGYANVDFELWPPFLTVGLFFFMFVGGCAGSTGGGLKVVRIMLLFKQAYEELYRIVHPRAVRVVKLGGRVVAPSILRSVANLFILWMLLFVLATLILAATGLDFTSALAASIANLGNIGPGFGTVGPTDNYAHLHWIAKIVCTICMLAGRLEIYAILILFVPAFWRR